MEQKTISIYGETYTMHIFLPEYVNECNVKQLRKIIKELVRTQFDSHQLESDLYDILNAIKYCETVATTKTRMKRLVQKNHVVVDAINTYTDRIEEYDK